MPSASEGASELPHHGLPDPRVAAARYRIESYNLPIGEARKRWAMGLPPLTVPAARGRGRLHIRVPLIERLERRGDLDSQHVEAAQNIRAICSGIQHCFGVRSIDMVVTRVDGANGVRAASEPDFLRADFVAAVRAWAQAAPLAFEATVVGPSLRSLERQYGVRSGGAPARIRIGLSAWSVIDDPRLRPFL